MSAAVNPYVAAGTAGVGIVTDIIGMIMQQQAMQVAQQEAKAIDFRNFSYSKERDKVSDRFNREQLKISKDQNQLSKDRFAQEKTLTGYSIAKDKAQQAIDLLNSNNALRDRVLRNWSM
jgi:protein tyrosine/serine phosphatase